MSVWRPHPTIRVKALGLAWSAGRLLAAEVRDDAGRLKGVRPLGGAVEFGERWRDALVREFAEELGLAVDVMGPPLVLESLFVHEGAPGHEIVFAADIRLPPGTIQGRAVVPFAEDDGTLCTARWFDPADLDRPDGPALFPDGLGARLAARR
ncbi:NUDIX domain-containing protein [Jannaschia sp. Os4]|uniref:NUDIX hydrolase n=1 Tax=Jannaschia sp. Os4 TaxID=2807617 RepID=UPI00193957AA|nr:NUDIX domain-containing protein [Jannaschia sp. Os4]MBM2575161.1 NUDIX domain-containing protein [Jannaschia sp. Os4]